ncbi:hypothetical protein JM658_07635 [Joostella atrarenae]|uniref:Uncharacterized protein n=1 Tax=Joostella atrarenae TaxID=679257 RepID=A0ABS9J2Q3_9FLAO|nr:hypothetical protein [Joostella atrarenae]MCF8714697.1 hypothetical protein [Joostella atrarenae]
MFFLKNIKLGLLVLVVSHSLILSCAKGSHKDLSEKYILDGIHKNPGEPYPQSNFMDPGFLASMGYNGQIINDFVSPVTTIDYNNYKQGMFPNNEDQKKWLEKRREVTNAKIESAHKAGINLYYWTDLFVLPTTIMNNNEKELKSEVNSKMKFDINQSLTQELLRYMLQEVFKQYPKLDGLVIRTGEIYTLDTPFHKGGILCHKPEDYKVLIEILREEVCVKLNKKIFFRTWGFDGFHTDPAYYLTVTDAIKPHHNLIFSIKHNRYHRMNPFSSVLTLGKHPQIIEYSCQRSFEGKGAYPNYIAKGAIEGFEEYKLMEPGTNKSFSDIIDHPNIVGLWSWSRGDGWAGPYLKNELWTELNAYVAVKWFRNPLLEERDIINDFAKSKGLRGKDIDLFRKISWLSADAVLRGREKYIGETEVNYDMPGRLWMRDHYMEGDQGHFKALRDKIIGQGHVEMALREKKEAVELWKEIVSLAERLTTEDKDLKDFIITSCKYGLIKYSIVEQFWTISLLGKQGGLDDNLGKQRISNAIIKYDELWKEWEDLYVNNPSCATLFKDEAFYCYLVDKRPNAGMGYTVEKYRKLIMNKQ